MFKYILAVFLIFPNLSNASETQNERFKRGDQIVLKVPTPACLTKELHREYTIRGLNDDEEGIRKMFVNKSDSPCIMIPPGRSFYILKAEYNNPHIAVLQIATKPSDIAGIWILGIEITKK